MTSPHILVHADREEPVFARGDIVRIGTRAPVGHYRVPRYVRGRSARVEAIIAPTAVDNEEEGFGRNAGLRRHYYRVAIAMSGLWPGGTGNPSDELHIEVFETWLEKTEA